MSQKRLEDAVIAKLVADTGAGTVYEAVTGRIYLYEAPDSTTEPLIVVNVISDPPDRYFQGRVDTDAEVQIDIYGDAEDQTLQDTNTKLFTALDNTTLTMSGHTANCQSIDRGFVAVIEKRMTITTRWRVIATAT